VQTCALPIYDEDRRARQEGEPGAPRAALLEGVLEELERDGGDQRARGEREERSRDAAWRRMPCADPAAQRQGDRSDYRKEERLTDAPTLAARAASRRRQVPPPPALPSLPHATRSRRRR